jgi:hypothetical protein
MGPRFFIALLSAFVVTAVLLGGAGYAVTRVAVPVPHDIFRAPAFEFALAPGWWCELDGNEYICSPPGKPPHPAMVVMAMKERNKDDNLAVYETYLRQPQQAGNRDKPSDRKSVLKSLKREIIGRREWVTALHSGSEIEGYDTYYLATATSYAGIVVTMSVHKDYTQDYVRQLNEMMKTLNVYQR